MSGATHDYKFGNKNNWRRWAWNRIDEMLPVPKKEALVLYLPGKDNLELPMLLERGYKKHNLIGVEKNSKNVQLLRKSGMLCLSGDIMDAVLSFPPDRKLDVVFGDFCSGIKLNAVASMVEMFFFLNLRSTIFAFNFQRGRDGESEKQRSSIIHITSQCEKQFGIKKLHRGCQFLAICLENFAGLNIIHHKNELKKNNISFRDAHAAFYRKISKDRVEPAYNQYRSEFCDEITGRRTVVFFDSVIFKNPFEKIGCIDALQSAEYQREKFSGPMRRQVSAILAHRTMRMK